MPRLRSGISKEEDSEDAWHSAVLEAAREMSSIETSFAPEEQERFAAAAAVLHQQLLGINRVPGRDGGEPGISDECPEGLRSWLVDRRLRRLSNSDTRGHMRRDLARYMFAALFAQVCGRTPKAREYPQQLAPKHKNWSTGKFADRFRVQVWDKPAKTVTCHISKDGHYFIHPDPSQCRSLTVREAARLQTFPDNYFFMGERTDQYVQVGNAVPPYLARQIAQLLFGILSSVEDTSAESPVELDEVA
jgi:DNA (cytosine-5)-methyltransferase 1